MSLHPGTGNSSYDKNRTFAALSSSELVLELKVIKAVVETPIKALKATVMLRTVIRCRLMKVQGYILDDIRITAKN
jgi:hypothetical protein